MSAVCTATKVERFEYEYAESGPPSFLLPGLSPLSSPSSLSTPFLSPCCILRWEFFYFALFASLRTRVGFPHASFSHLRSCFSFVLPACCVLPLPVVCVCFIPFVFPLLWLAALVLYHSLHPSVCAHIKPTHMSMWPCASSSKKCQCLRDFPTTVCPH